MGALVISNTAWSKISPGDQAILAAAAKTAEKRFFEASTTADDNSIASMKTRGLTVNTPDAKGAGRVPRRGDRLVTSIRGTLVPNGHLRHRAERAGGV
jgi:hypothetical protein